MQTSSEKDFCGMNPCALLNMSVAISGGILHTWTKSKGQNVEVSSRLLTFECKEAGWEKKTNVHIRRLNWGGSHGQENLVLVTGQCILKALPYMTITEHKTLYFHPNSGSHLGSLEYLLSRHFHNLLYEATKALPSQAGDVISSVCPSLLQFPPKHLSWLPLMCRSSSLSPHSCWVVSEFWLNPATLKRKLILELPHLGRQLFSNRAKAGSH